MEKLQLKLKQYKKMAEEAVSFSCNGQFYVILIIIPCLKLINKPNLQNIGLFLLHILNKIQVLS